MTFFLVFVPLLAIILLIVNLLFATHDPYKEKNSPFECGFHSFLAQNRTQFNISFFIFALLFLLFDLEILLVYPYVVSAYANGIYGLMLMLIFFLVLTLGFAFELGKGALKLTSRQNNLEIKPIKNICSLKTTHIKKYNLASKTILKNEGIFIGVLPLISNTLYSNEKNVPSLSYNDTYSDLYLNEVSLNSGLVVLAALSLLLLLLIVMSIILLMEDTNINIWTLDIKTEADEDVKPGPSTIKIKKEEDEDRKPRTPSPDRGSEKREVIRVITAIRLYNAVYHKGENIYTFEVPDAVLSESNVVWLHNALRTNYPHKYEIKQGVTVTFTRLRGEIATHIGKSAALRPGVDLLARIATCPE